ncbi:MAG: hypothetical protein LBP64_09210 [Tannerella sp.]|jgi:hypothetical protein|nr:hypothetical protein [Tannerella sp.]
MDDNKDIPVDVVNGAAPELGSIEFVGYTASEIVLKSNVVKANGYAVSERGFCWGTETLPTVVSGRYIAAGNGKGEFADTIKNLQGNTKYYFRAYAVNEKGMSYSDEDSLTTNSGLGKVRTLEVTNRRATTAVGGGKIELYGEGEIVSYGIFKALSADMTNKDTVRSTNPIVGDSFLCNISGLSADTRYYVQAFVSNQFGTFAGNNVVYFTTGNGKPVIDSAKVLNPSTDIGYTEVTVVSGVLEGGDSTIDESGFCWSENPMPSTESGIKIPCRFRGEIGPFVAQIDGLIPHQTYYFRAYAKNGFGTVYSNQLVIQTKSQLPSLKTNLPAVNNALGTVVFGGQILDQGKSSIIAKGVCYSLTNTKPTTADDMQVNIGVSETFSIELSGLRGETTYYVRAYARNSEGESYGETMTITTPQIFNGGLSPFPGTTPLEASSAYFIIGNRFYLLGGDIGPNYTAELFSYDRPEGKWRKLWPHPAGAFKWQSVVVGIEKTAYVLGGMSENNKASNAFYQYVPANNTWYPMPKGPDSAYLRTGVALDDKIYYFGGMKDTAKNEVWEYTANVDGTWTTKPTLPEAQYGGIAVGIDSIVYVGFGKNTFGVCNRTLWKSADKMMTWAVETELAALGNGVLVGVAFKKKIYVIDESYRIHEYNPQTALWRTKSLLPSSMRDIQCMYATEDLIFIGFGNNSLVMYNPLWDN